MAVVYNRLGVVNFRLGEAGKALNFLLKSYKNNSANVDNLISLGEIYFASGALDRTRRYYEKASHCENFTAESWSRLGEIYCHLGIAEQALNCFQQAINADGRFAESYINKGVIEFSMGKRQKAINSLLKAEEILFLGNSNGGAKDFFKKCWEVDSDSRDSLHQVASLSWAEEDIQTAINYEESCVSSTVKKKIIYRLTSLRDAFAVMGLSNKAKQCDAEIEIFNREIGAGIR